MRVESVHILNFRSLRDVELSFDEVTILVGANGAGKSSVLHALDWFFAGGALTPEDVSGHQADEQISVAVTFGGLSEDDRAALGAFVSGDHSTFWRTWSIATGEQLTGEALAYAGFALIRGEEGALARRNVYNATRQEHPEFQLPSVRSAAAVDAALADWESAHPDQLSASRIDARGVFGGSAHDARVDFVLVPAVSDPEAETSDARGTLLRQLLDRALGDQSVMQDQLEQLVTQMTEDVERIISTEGGEALEGVADGVSAQLARLVPGGEIVLTAHAEPVRVPRLAVDVRVDDEGLQTAVGRQGHGFQRALLIAIVQQLAAQGDAKPEPDATERRPSRPTLLLAFEEPELYQHPLQARHFAATLSLLAEQSEPTIQVAYATHSEHFVDPAHYQRLRRFRRRPGSSFPESDVTQALVARVVRRLSGVYAPEQIALRVKMTLRRQVAEAVFAKAAVCVEGATDAALLHGLADRDEGFDGRGVAVVAGHSKRQLLIPWAILTELGVPTYAVFDADGAQGSAQSATDNQLVLGVLGAEPELQPQTRVTPLFAVFADTLESELAAWEGFAVVAQAARDEEGDWRTKSDDAYRHAAATTAAEPPPVFVDLMRQIATLAN